jgi:hypothetical protein
MVEQYYFSQGDTPFGPFSAAEMRDLAAAGRIRPTDPLWRAGTGNKVLAARVKNLFAAPPPPAQPAPALPADPVSEAPPARTPVVATPPASGRFALAVTRRGPEPPARPKRVVSVKGAVLMGQDGVKVQFRKKCGTCGHEDGCRSSAVIRLGAFRVAFFWPKCRRARAVEFTAVS